MKLTKNKLKDIVKEELLNEVSDPSNLAIDIMRNAEKIKEKYIIKEAKKSFVGKRVYHEQFGYGKVKKVLMGEMWGNVTIFLRVDYEDSKSSSTTPAGDFDWKKYE